MQLFSGVIPKPRAFTSGARNLPYHECVLAGDPSLRLKSGSAQDDAAILVTHSTIRPACPQITCGKIKDYDNSRSRA